MLFLALKVFAATGGIEKVCRVAGKAMYEMSVQHNSSCQIYSMYDEQSDADDNRYFPSENFRGFGSARIKFIAAAVEKGRKSDVVVLSHINLLVVGWMIKKLSPSTKIILFAHGIEVWTPLRPRQKMMLGCCDKIISVSNFTSDKIKELHRIAAERCDVLNNCLDPFLPVGFTRLNQLDLHAKYGYSQENKIIFTLTRLSSRERYKGYDQVLEAMVTLKDTNPELRYLLAGSYDAKEKRHLDKMIADLGLTAFVHIAGFIPDEDLVAHFLMADMYVMPSMKEGFGIVFIEAMFYGLPVIAGNKDGSVDAVCNGELGLLVDPQEIRGIEDAIQKILTNRKAYIPNRELLMKRFSYDNYKIKLEALLS